MGRFRTGNLVEAGLWLALVIFLYAYSFEFDRDIEIYRYGATAWPRAILLLIAIAAIGQLLSQARRHDETPTGMFAAAADDAADDTSHNSFGWYLCTFLLLAIPFIYMNLPEWIIAKNNIPEAGQARVKIITAAVLLVIYLIFTWRNHVGGILALPVFFAALLEDMGFYALAPFFIIGVMILMGERRLSRMAMIMPLIYGLLLLCFVKLLYVGLPTGYVRPFYDFGNWVVALLQ
jgi:hypothetical protein